MTLPPPRHPALLRIETLLLAALVPVVLYAVSLSVFYKTDGPDLLLMVMEQDHVHPWHPFSVRLIEWWQGWLTDLGLVKTSFESAKLLSAVAMGLCVGWFHFGLCLLRTGRLEALLAGLLLAASPGVVLFGATVELHAPFLAVAAMAFAATAALVRVSLRGVGPVAMGIAICIGVLSHGSLMLHATGIVLPWVLMVWFVALRHGSRCGSPETSAVELPAGNSPGGVTWAGTIGLGAIVAVVHGGLVFGLPAMFPADYGVFVDLFGMAASKEAEVKHMGGVETMPLMAWQEWLVPLAPIAFTWLAAWFMPRLGNPAVGAIRAPRWEALALVVGLLPLVYLSGRQLVLKPEQGAYLLPGLFLAARVTAAVLPSRILWFLVVASIVVSGLRLHAFEDRDGLARWRTRAQTMAAGGTPFFVLASNHEIGMAFASNHDFVSSRKVADTLPDDLTPLHLQQIAFFLEPRLAAGEQVLLTADSYEFLATRRTTDGPGAKGSTVGPEVLEFIQQTYLLTEAELDGERYYRLERR